MSILVPSGNNVHIWFNFEIISEQNIKISIIQSFLIPLGKSHIVSTNFDKKLL